GSSGIYYWWTFASLEGTYVYTGYCNDTASNQQNTETRVLNVEIDKPIIIININDTEVIYNNESVLIDWDVADQYINYTYANVTYPDDSLLEELSNQSINFNFIPANLTQTGEYIVTVYANDLAGNSNTTTATFEVIDTGIPQITLVSPEEDVILNYNDITFICNATDNIGLKNISLYHNLTGTFLANETQDITGLANQTNFTINNIAEGYYIWSCEAYDTDDNGNLHLNNHSLTIDLTAPIFENVQPSINAQYNQTNVIPLNIKLDDNSTIFANLTYPNSTSITIPLTYNGTDWYYSTTFGDTLTIGNYTITLNATDLAGNSNTTSTNFIINDINAPLVSDISPTANTLYNQSDIVELSVNVTDYFYDYVDTVIIQIVDPDGTVTNYSLTELDNTQIFDTQNFTNTILPGRYNITIFANDTSGNMNSAQTSYFNVQDITNPLISIITPLNLDIVGWDVLLKANVTDLDLEDVWFEIRNGSSTSSSLIQGNYMNNIDDIYNATLFTNETWPYDNTLTNTTNLTLIVYANDTSGNQFNQSTTFILDNTMPGIQFVAPTQSGSFYNSNFNLEIYLSNHKLNYSYYNITNASGEVLTNDIDLNQASYTWNDLINTSNLVEGNYTIFVHAEDWSDPTHNINNKTTWFYIDITPPNATVETGGWITPTPVNNSFTSTQTQTFNMTCDETFPDTIWIDFNGTIDSTPTGSAGIYYWWTIPSLEGTYSYTGYCNDTASNQQNTETRVLNVDITEPLYIEPITPLLNSQYNQTNNIPLTICVDENSTLTANITWDSTSQLLTLDYNGTDYCYENTFTNTNYLDNYNILINATDLSGNSNQTSTNFTINDITNPDVSTISPSGIEYNQTNSILINANVTDPYYNNVDTVIANISWDSTYEIVEFTYNSSTGLYDGTFTNTNMIGLYNINIIANDTSSNINSSQSSNFTINDITTPSVSDIAPVANTLYNQTDIVELSVNVTDYYNDYVDTVIIQIIDPEGTVTNYTLTELGNTQIFDTQNFTNTILPGRYNITIFANDTSGNMNASQISYFNVQDITDPTFIEPTIPILNSQYNQTDNVALTICVNENSTLTANITWDSTSQLLTLDYNGTDYCYENTFTNTNYLDNYNILINATDLSGNSNQTSTNFTINDITNPDVSTISPSGVEYNQTNSILINANVTDPYYNNVDTVLANISWDSTYEIVEFTYNSSTGLYDGTFTNTNMIGLYNINIIANDTSSNINSSQSSNFTINDITTPSVSDIAPVANTLYNQTDIVELSVNVTDYYNDYVDTVIIQIIDPEGTVTNYTLTELGNTQIFDTQNFTNTILPGRYNITIFANDTSGNMNASQISYFNVQDITDPLISIITPLNLDIVGWSVLLKANVTDLDLEDVWFEIRNGSSTSSSLIQGNYMNNIDDIYNATLFTNETWPYDNTLTNTTNLTLIVYANDTSGNLFNQSTTFILDNTKPGVQFVAPTQSGSFYNSNFNLEIYLSNHKLNYSYYNITNASGQVLTNEINLNQASYTWNDLINVNNLVEGNYSIFIHAEDWSQPIHNINNKTTWFYIDKTLPNITVETTSGWIDPTPANNTFTTTQTQTFNMTCNETFPDTIWIDFNGTIDSTPTGNNGIYYWWTIPSLEGTYSYIGYCNDTASNQQNTETRVLNVDITKPYWETNKTLPATNIIYHPGTDYQFNVSWNDNYNIHTVLFNHNFTGSLINSTPTNSANDEYYYDLSSIPVGTYVWKSYANDSAGNMNVTDQWTYTVLQNTTTCSLTFNESSPLIYEKPFIASCVCTNPETTPKLYRNGTDITSEIDQPVILGVDTYEYICNISETYNYTSAANSSSFQITQASSEVNLTLNNIDNNITIESGEFVNLSAYLIHPTGLINLYEDNTQINTGNNFITNYSQYILPLTHNITLYYPETQNYSESVETHFIIVEDTTQANITIEPFAVNIVSGIVTLRANVTDLNLEQVWYEIRNGTLITDSIIDSGTMANISVNVYNASFNTNDTWPYDSTLSDSLPLTLIIYANDTSSNVAYKNLSFILDNSDPEIQFNYPQQGVYVNSIFNLDVLLTDYNLSYSYYNITNATISIFNETNLLSSNFNWTDLIDMSSLIDGNYTLTVYAKDASSPYNDITQSIWFMLDGAPPNATVDTEDGWVYPTPINYYNTTTKLHTFNFTCYDTNLDNIWLEFNGFNSSYPTGTASYYYWWTLNLQDGTYSYTGHCNDTAANYASTDQRTITIDTLEPVWTDNKTSPTTVATYAPNQNYQFNITWTDVLPHIILFEHNFTGTLQNSTASDNVGNEYYYNISNLNVGTYVWKSYANDTQGLSNVSDQFIYTIEKATPTCYLNFDPISPIEYETLLNVSCTCNTIEAPAQLWRNETNVTSENYNNTLLQVGVYEYKCNISETQNYNPSENSSTFEVVQQSKIVNLTLNDIDNNITIESGDFVNITGSLIRGNENIYLYQNGILINSGNNSIWNYTQYILPLTHNITLYSPDNNNYTETSETHYIIVEDTIAPNISIITPLDLDVAGWDILLRSDVSDLNLDKIWYEIRNGSSTTSPLIYQNTMNNIGGDTYNSSLHTTEIWPYDVTLANSTNLTLIVYANDTSGNVFNQSTTWILDNSMPGIQYIDPSQPGSYYNTNFNLNIYLSNHKLNYSYYNITNASGTILSNQINLAQPSYTWTDLIDIISLIDGNYSIFVYAEDWSQPTHNINNKTTWFVVDIVDPLYYNIEQESEFDQTDIAYIGLNMSETSTITVNVVWDSTSEQLPLTYNATTGLYEARFNNTNWIGQYNLSFNITDLANNNNVTYSSFIINDVTAPIITDISPASGSTYEPYSIINISANVTDPYYNNVDTVLANITWDSTFELLEMVYNATSGLYEVIFTNTTLTGTYNVNIIANDTSNNINQSSFNFNIFNTVPPIVNAYSPGNNTIINESSYTFEFNVTDDYWSTLNCSILIDNTIYQTNLSVLNNTLTSIIANTIPDGVHEWFIRCYDGGLISSQSETRTITSDTTAPIVHDIIFSPYSAMILQNNIINITSNVSDNIELDTILVNIKLPNGTTETYVSPASFNGTLLGAYNVTVFANDTAGNNVYANNHYFVAGETLIDQQYNLINSTGGISGLVNIYYANGTLFLHEHSIFGLLIDSHIADYILDYEYIPTGGMGQIILHGINITVDNNQTFGYEEFGQGSGFEMVIGINSTFSSMQNATITLNYSTLTFGNENYLYAYKCDDFDFLTNYCSSGWYKLSYAEHNQTTNTFTIVVNSFSGFAIKDETPQDSGSGGGGGGIGGAPLITPPTNVTPEVNITPEVNVTVPDENITVPDDNITIESDTCKDGILNNEEFLVDCGGTCPPCVLEIIPTSIIYSENDTIKLNVYYLGMPLSSIELNIIDSLGVTHKIITDENGYAEISDLPLGQIIINSESLNYKSTDLIISLEKEKVIEEPTVIEEECMYQEWSTYLFFLIFLFVVL
ncbi:hypothetical protein ACFL1H_04380, partial [Nanoarchaeota archaeon]